MSELNSMKLFCQRWEDIVTATNDLVICLPADVRKQFARTISAYFHRFGLEGTFVRINDKTVAQILAEFNLDDEPTAIESGMVEGVRYELFESPGATEH